MAAVAGSTEEEAAFMVAARAWAEAAATTEASLAHAAGTVVLAAVSAADLAVDLAALAAASTRLAEASVAHTAAPTAAPAVSVNATVGAAASAEVSAVPDSIRAWGQASTHGADMLPPILASPTASGTILAGPLAHLPLSGAVQHAASVQGPALAAGLARA